MDKLSIIKEAVNTEKKIEKLITGFNTNQENIARIDIDLTLEHIRKLYDLVLQLESADSAGDDEKQQETPVEAVKVEVTESSEVVEVKEPEEPVVEQEEVKTTEEPVAEQEEVIEQKPAVTPDLFETEPEPEKKQEETGKPNKEESVSAGVTMDLFGETIGETIGYETDKTIADTISENIKEESVADVINKSAIDDLKAAIGINEKFFFINELFDGNMKDYNEVIDTLNNYTGKDEALSFFEELKGKYEWQNENEAVAQLRELIGRRFAS